MNLTFNNTMMSDIKKEEIINKISTIVKDKDSALFEKIRDVKETLGHLKNNSTFSNANLFGDLDESFAEYLISDIILALNLHTFSDHNYWIAIKPLFNHGDYLRPSFFKKNIIPLMEESISANKIRSFHKEQLILKLISSLEDSFVDENLFVDFIYNLPDDPNGSGLLEHFSSNIDKVLKRVDSKDIRQAIFNKIIISHKKDYAICKHETLLQKFKIFLPKKLNKIDKKNFLSFMKSILKNYSKKSFPSALSIEVPSMTYRLVHLLECSLAAEKNSNISFMDIFLKKYKNGDTDFFSDGYMENIDNIEFFINEYCSFNTKRFKKLHEDFNKIKLKIHVEILNTEILDNNEFNL